MALERALPPTDLQTLLIAVARTRAGQVTAAAVIRRWQGDRFVQPAACDPRRVVAVEEVVSDSTNVLAIEAAARRRRQARNDRIDLAACHRQLRAQVFGPGASRCMDAHVIRDRRHAVVSREPRWEPRG